MRAGSAGEGAADLIQYCGRVPGAGSREGVINAPMRAIFAFLGTFLAGSIGWAVGERVGLGTAVVLSAVGSGFGLYWGRKLFDEWLG